VTETFPTPCTLAAPVGGSGRLVEWEGTYLLVYSPTGAVDPQRRWILVTPGWLVALTSRADGRSRTVPEHIFYLEGALARGFHVVGIESGPLAGSPAGAELYQRLYRKLLNEHQLAPRARLIVQSNGGLMGYAWAFRHPTQVERIFGIYPVTDVRSWPGLDKIAGEEPFTGRRYRYGLSLDELTQALPRLNPVEQAAALARGGPQILHVHGVADETVPIGPNSNEFCRRFRAAGGTMQVTAFPGIGHTPCPEFYQSQAALDFLLA
jgi:pimeloyl-ACP methyl ester carboxylesterase